MSKLALVIDDEPDIRNLLRISLERMQIHCMEAGTLARAVQLLESRRFDVCLTDMRLPDGNGIDLVRRIQSSHPELPVAVITAHGSMETAVEALKAGAFDFISKPVKLDELRRIVEAAVDMGERLSSKAPEEIESDLLGDSPPMQRLRDMIRKVARSQSPVYIHGNTGTGKELVARLIHRSSGRKDGPWVPVNCGAIPAELMESEFFGHKKGSFTGAHEDKPGLFEAASGGTLFLDEVAELPLSMQVKLLRAIQERKTKPVGGNQERAVDVRILSATHANLADLVAAGKFRNDLYYRLNVIELRVPDLRERREDIPTLANYFLARLNDHNDAPVKTLSDSALELLQNHHFPGNIRELENIIERAYTLSNAERIAADEILIPNDGIHDETRGSEDYRPGDEPLDDHLAEIERRALVAAIEKAGGNKTVAAELLGMSFRSIRYKLKKYGL
ncbi:MAG: sigma-54-dependent Fis family transcriptional regulator [Proteobacteria bacterium]|nr:MAG: sigma-54-dependent Fis family transcriptional regulator [Pseudomonadota bacterium]